MWKSLDSHALDELRKGQTRIEHLPGQWSANLSMPIDLFTGVFGTITGVLGPFTVWPASKLTSVWGLCGSTPVMVVRTENA